MSWILIRPATAADLDAIETVHVAAFTSTRLGYQGEGALVRALLRDGDALVSLVAERSGAVMGHALFSRMEVEADGAPLRGAALAPVGVVPSLHGAGVGSMLIGRGHEQLREQGAQISFVLGDPGYYGRFGYSAELASPFASPYAGPHLMALFLDPALARPASGKAAHARAFADLG